MVWYNMLSYTYSDALTSSGSIFLGASPAYCWSLDGGPTQSRPLTLQLGSELAVCRSILYTEYKFCHAKFLSSSTTYTRRHP